MTSLDALASYAAWNWRDGGLELASLGELPVFEIAAMQDEAERIVKTLPSSDVQNKAHVTNWTRPYGTVRQWSLMNAEGATGEQASDYRTIAEGKRLAVHVDSCLGMFAREHPGLVNMRLNLMGPESGLSLHREATAIRVDGRVRLKLRFHLPLSGGFNPCRVGHHHYTMRVGEVYLFNNGAPHASWNHGRADRVHLVWDTLASKETLKSLELLKLVDPLEMRPLEPCPSEQPEVTEEEMAAELRGIGTCG